MAVIPRRRTSQLRRPTLFRAAEMGASDTRSGEDDEGLEEK